MTKPPVDLSGRKITQEYFDLLMGRYKDTEMEEILEMFKTFKFWFFSEVSDQNRLTIGTALDLDSRTAIMNMFGDNYNKVLEILNPVIDQTFVTIFSPIEEWLDNKYETVEKVDQRIADALSKDLQYYNDVLVKNNMKSFTEVFLETCLKMNVIDTLNDLKV